MPGSIIDNMPPRPDDIQRRQRDAERRAREQAAAKSGQAMQIGAGGITVTDGGSITISGTGALHVGSGALDSAGSITAATDITAGGTVQGADIVSTGGASIAGALTAASENVTGNVVAGGQVQSNGSPFKSQPSYNYNPTTAYEALYIDGTTYQIGYVASTRASKKNLEPYPHELVEKLLTTKVHHGHYLHDDDDAPKKTFLIVEDLAEAGFGPDIAVRDPETGAPRSINYAHLVPGLLAAIQHLQAQIDDLKNG